MKISKLFHWLYAILLFLPILVFIPNAFYYGFNKEAVAQEKTINTIYYPSNVVSNANDLILENAYYWNDNFTTTISSADRQLIIYNNDYLVNITHISLQEETYFYMSTNIDRNMTLRRGSNDTYVMSINNNRFPFVLRGKSSNVMQDTLNSILPYYDFIKTPSVTYSMSITDSMSYAWDSTWQNDLFSWSYDSFLTQPFLYISNLFNVPSTNTLLYCLSYWLNISIIWLVFDVVLYVPLLVHRWLDKGIVE